MKSKRVLYLSQEVEPYLSNSEIATQSRYLPQYMQERGNEMRLFMPRYGVINERSNQLHEVKRLSGINMIINDQDHLLVIKVASIQAARMQVYFIDNDDFFKRKTLFGYDAKTGNDNDDRSIFFVRGALETIKKLRWIPDIIHCHGWFSVMAIIYLKKVYKDDPCLKKAKIIVSIYNEAESVDMPETLFEKLAFDGIKGASIAMMNNKTDYKAMMKLAIHHAHGVVQGSEELDGELHELIQSSNKPFLPYQGKENYADAYNEFYDKVL